MKNQDTQTLFVGLSFLAVGLIIGLLVNSSPKSNTVKLNVGSGDQTSDEFVIAESIGSISIDDDAVLGNPDAKVTLVEFSDFQCPFCRSFHVGAFQQIKKEYIDTGLVNFVYRDFPLTNIHPQAQIAAEAAECVGETSDELYFQMHDLIFSNTSLWSGNPDAESVLAQLAEDNLDVDISSCLADGLMTQEVVDDQAAAYNNYGVRPTPTTFVNGIPVVGALTFEEFQMVIESQL